MAEVVSKKIQCPFHLFDRCKNGGGKGVSKAYLLKHFKTCHFADAERIDAHRERLSNNHQLYGMVEKTLKHIGVWLCGDCFSTHTFSKDCRHSAADVVLGPDQGDNFINFTIAKIPKPCNDEEENVADNNKDSESFECNFSTLDSVFNSQTTTIKSLPPKSKLCFSKLLKLELDNIISNPSDAAGWVKLLILPKCVLKTFKPRNSTESRSNRRKQLQMDSILEAMRTWREPGGIQKLVRDIVLDKTDPQIINQEDLGLDELNLKQCKRKLGDGQYTAACRVLTSSGVAPNNNDTLKQLRAKHPIVPVPNVPVSSPNEEALVANKDVVLGRIRSFPKGTSCGRDGLRAQHLCDALSGAAAVVAEELIESITGVVNLFLCGKCPSELGEYVASAPLTPLIKPGGGIRPIAVGTIWRRLVSKTAAVSVGKSVGQYLGDLQFGVGVSGGGESILHSVNRLVEELGNDDSFSLLLVDFQNAFNLVDREVIINEVRLICPSIAYWVEFCYAQPARLYYGDAILQSCQGVQQGIRQS